MDEHDPLNCAIQNKLAFLEGALNIDMAWGRHQDKLEVYLAFPSKTSEDGWMEDSLQFETREDMVTFLDKVVFLIRTARAQHRGE